MSRRRKRRKPEGDVELNLAAMLDMAFQLLTFFILTFHPAPVEGQIGLRMPPAQPVSPTKNAVQAGADATNTDPVQGVETLTISVIPSASGGVGSLAVGDETVTTPTALGDLVRSKLSAPGSPFQQIIIQVGSGLRYDALMSVVDVCSQQKLPNGQKLTKMSFVELQQ